ncbi:hypothetical protein GCM10009809_18220 [Isoptericola hypogeus]|uniref:HNH nuclease domain-containing protein n=1 Tax=Isoptericola hypogeus TaxID=300179 RepID=A0ABN2JCW7_9MICO
MLDAALEAAVAEQALMNAAAGRRTIALAGVVEAADADLGTMLDLGVDRIASASLVRRSSVAHRALIAEVSCSLGVGEQAAQSLLEDAEVLASKATGTLGLLCQGDISYQHAAKLAGVVADLPATAVADVERVVLGRAPELTAAKFGALAEKVRDVLHPVPAELRCEAARLKANVWLDDDKDGMTWLTALLPTAAARAAYDRVTRTAARAKAAGDPRGVGQLRAATLTALLLDDDAAKNGAKGSTGSGSSGGGPADDGSTGDGSTGEGPTVRRSTDARGREPGTGERREQPRPPVPPGTGEPPGPPGPRERSTAVEPVEPPEPVDVPDPLEVLARSIKPVLHVTVPITTLTGVGEGSATLDGVVPIDAETARLLAAGAPTLRRVLTDPVTGAMLTLERRTYVVPADLRAFLTQRDVTCRFPGCRIPARRCDVDHTIAWADGGTTDATNLAHLCRRHHTLKHESRWQVEQLADGVLAWTSPRGRTHLTTPGVAEQVLGRLDAWAVEARYLADETPPDPSMSLSTEPSTDLSTLPSTDLSADLATDMDVDPTDEPVDSSAADSLELAGRPADTGVDRDDAPPF